MDETIGDLNSVSYRSTRSEAEEAFEFSDVLMAGLAADGGLYSPDEVPDLAEYIAKIDSDSDYNEVAANIFMPFVGDSFGFDELKGFAEAGYAKFENGEVGPTKQIGHDSDSQFFLVDLSTGPTLAFKDVAMQMLGGMIEAELTKRSGRATIIGATSGDTGGAAIAAFAKKKNVEVLILHPHGRVSPVQRRQMTTSGAPNIHNLAIEGTFDDCQDLVKAVLGDVKQKQELNLVAINSINWARVMAQTVYYASTVAKIAGLTGNRSPVDFAVPSGNFGNVLAGWYAKRMGVNIGKFVVASNSNDVLTRFFETGTLELRPVAPTISPSMDIQVSSNLERLLWEASGRDGGGISDLISQLRSTDVAKVPQSWSDAISQDFCGFRSTEPETKEVIEQTYRDSGAVMDPHTAVGLVAARKFVESQGSSGAPIALLATAHPAKFPEAISAQIGIEPPRPAPLEGIEEKQENFEVAPNDKEILINKLKELNS